MQQKPVLHNFQHLELRDWSLAPRNQAILLTNNHSGDEFLYDRLYSNMWHLLDGYRARAAYRLPHTPQVLLASRQADPHSIEMFVQVGAYGLQKLVKKSSSENAVLELMRSIISAVEVLVKKYGAFRLVSGMIKATKGQEFLVWVHQNYNSIHRQLPLSSKNAYEDVRVMVMDLLTIMQGMGCSKQMDSFKSKIQTQKLLTFEKCRVILQNIIGSNQRSNEKAARVYHSPQFLKRRASQSKKLIQKSTNENFSIYLKPAREGNRYATSINLGYQTPNKSENSNESHKECKSSEKSCNSQKKIDENRHKMDPLFQQNARSMFVMITDSNILDEAISVSSKQYSSNNQRSARNQVQHEISEQINMKKKGFRDSANSLATTAFVGSMASSGKVKFNNFDEHNFNCSSTTSLSGLDGKKALASSVGIKETKKIRQLKQNFKVKASKIIEQNSEQVGTPCSFIKSEKQNQALRESQIERDIGDLLDSQQSSSRYRPSSDLLDLENQIHNVLFG